VTGRHRDAGPGRRRGPASPGTQRRTVGSLSGLDLVTLPRRAAAHAGPLVLVAVLVALATVVGSAVPRAVARVADDAVASAVERAGAAADVVISSATGYEDTATATNPEAASDAVTAATQLDAGLRARVGDVVAAPVVVTASVPLALAAPEGASGGASEAGSATVAGSTTLRLAWTHGAGTVRWTGGTAPGPDDDAVQVGLSEAVATALGAAPGTLLSATDADGRTVALVVSGVFRADEPGDPRWTDLGDLLEARTARVGPATSTAAAALLSDASLPGALAALDPRTVVRSVRFAPLPAQVGTAQARRVLAELPAVQASPVVLGSAAARASVHTGLDGTLGAALAEVDHARDEAAGLVVGAAAVTALLLALTAGLLARRRTADLAARRTRGATLPALTVEHALEAAVVAATGAGAGLLVAHLLAPGPVVLGQAVPVAALAVVALPAAARHAVRSAADPPPRREHGGNPARGQDGRRVAVELALVALAAGAVVAARGRQPGAGPDLLAAAAPAAAAAVGAVVLARLVPLGLGRLGPLVRRSRRAVPVLALARARSDGPGPLPLLALATAAALVVVAASGAQQVGRDQEAAATASVGADVLVHGDPDAALARAAEAWSRAPGVTATLPARVADDVPAVTDAGRTRVRLLAADPAALRRLTAATSPAATAPSTDGDTLPPGTVELTWAGESRTVHPLRDVPAPGWSAVSAEGDDRPLVVVDVAELGGADAAPDTVWLAGSGAAGAVRADPPADRTVVVERAAVLEDLRSEVLPRAVVLAALATAALLLGLVGLAVLVQAARGGPARRRALDTLRTVGLTDREAAAVAAGEILPGVLAATLVGAFVGVGVTVLLAGTSTAGPAIAWSWTVLPAAVGAVVALGVVAVEQARGGTHRLGDVLRAAD
jgi:putative ABC transport system permease protein